MNQEEKHLHKIYRVGDRSFPIYFEYDEQMGESYPAYPDFEIYPQYTSRGQPFVTSEQTICKYAKAKKGGKTTYKLW